MSVPVPLRLVVVLGLLALSMRARADEPRQPIIVSGAVIKPWAIAVAPPTGPRSQVETFNQTLSNDLRISGLFNVLDPKSFLADTTDGTTITNIAFPKWSAVGTQVLAKAKLALGGSTLNAELWLFECVDCAQPTEALHSTDTGGPFDASAIAHRWANKIYEHFTGEPGFFQTRIAFVRKLTTGKEIWVADFDGHNAVALTPGGGLNLLPSWSRDGRSVVFTSYRNGSPMLYTADVGSHVVRTLPLRGELQTGAVFSPDGKRIAFTMSERGNSDIYEMNVDGSGIKQLTNSREIDTSPSWSPDGQRVAFVSTRSGDPQLFAMSAEGGSIQRLTFQGHYNQTPAWSPRGDVIAFTARDERNVFDIFTVDVASHQIKRLTQDAGNNEHPSYSPNGRNIIFVSTRGGRSRLWVMNADGSNQQQLSLDAEASSPAWGPWTR